uniref:Uncharacterized protein n=1 Tax=Chenopodium quinoa TaxID=63459 RepID=A0A803N593_CHEQI
MLMMRLLRPTRSRTPLESSSSKKSGSNSRSGTYVVHQKIPRRLTPQGAVAAVRDQGMKMVVQHQIHQQVETFLLMSLHHVLMVRRRLSRG